MPTQSEADRDDPLLGAFEVVEEGKRGNFTWKRLQLKPCHPGFDGDLHIVSVPELVEDDQLAE
jgi:hypothetical protein